MPSAYAASLKSKAVALAARLDPEHPQRLIAQIIAFDARDALSARLTLADAAGTWITKGGTSMICRIPQARATRDLDLSTQRDLADALTILNAVADIDGLGDHYDFRVVSTAMLAEGDGQPYRDGASVKVEARIDGERSGAVVFKVDVVSSPAPSMRPDAGVPAYRVAPLGVVRPKVLQYPVVDHVAEKYFAMHELYRGKPSSRVKDGVDVLLFARTHELDAGELRAALDLHSALRQTVLSVARPPVLWTQAEFSRWTAGTIVDGATLAEHWRVYDALFVPVIQRRAMSARWDTEQLCWA